MNYNDELRWLFGRRRMGMKYGLDRMRAMMEDLGHPERAFKTVHVVGTNGKGSTAAMLSAIAGELGISWGRGTSPHLLDYRERIVVNDEWISESEVADFVSGYKHLFTKHTATFFEITTAMAAWYFARSGVEWVVAEAGLGGRLDATRVYNGLGTVFTGVRVEHSRILGDTPEKIAAEKVAIASPNTILVAGRQTTGVERVIESAVTAEKLRRLHPVSVDRSPLPGAHQIANGSLALSAAQNLFGFSAEEVREAYDRTCDSLHWPGRLDYRFGSPDILFDVAHNPQSMEALVNHIRRWNKPVPMVVGFLADKPWRRMVAQLKEVTGTVVATTPLSERRLPAVELAGYMRNNGFQVEVHEDIVGALARCREIGGDGPVVVTGSFYVVGEAINAAVSRGWAGRLPDSW